MRRELVERARLGEQRVDATGAVAFEVVAAVGVVVEDRRELGARRGRRVAVDDAFDHRVPVPVERRDDRRRHGLRDLHLRHCHRNPLTGAFEPTAAIGTRGPVRPGPSLRRVDAPVGGRTGDRSSRTS